MTAADPRDKFQNAILENYELLQNNGILDYIDDRNERIMNLQYVIESAREIVNQPETVAMLDKVASSFLDRFIPSYLMFVIEEASGGEKPRIITYQRMKQIDPPVSIPSLVPYRHFFRQRPEPIPFKEFQYSIADPELSDPFKAVEAALVVPIIGFEQVYGFIVVGTKVLGGDYDEYEIEFVESLMYFASKALQSSIHYTRAITDSKTRLYNHGFVMSRLGIELDRVKRYHYGLAIVLIDVDNFKRFNDAYGHVTGDLLLLKISEILSESVRKGDIAGRFGGEEFVLLLANCGKLDACLAAERIREKVASLQLTENGETFSATISLGIRHVTEHSIRAADQLMREADKALYHSKQNGRNRSTIASTR